MVNVKKNDFVQLEFSAYANGELFDSTKEEEIKKLNPDAKPRPVIAAVGQKMIVDGFDASLEGKEIGKDYEIKLSPKDAFGERNRALVRIVPVGIFTERKIRPQAGMTLALDNNLVKILSVSGGRVSVDFNNPLSGKEIVYKFKITRQVTEDKEKSEALFEAFFRFVPKFELGEKITVSGPKILEAYTKAFSPKFKELIGKELAFKEEIPKKEEKKEEVKKEETKTEEKK
jgi:FKBP-type peptidyl-prolyl cis-trans isomerase 2